MTIKLFPMAKRPLPLVDGKNADALVGYTCVNVVLDIDHCATCLRRGGRGPTPLLARDRKGRTVTDRTRATTRPATRILGDSTGFRRWCRWEGWWEEAK